MEQKITGTSQNPNNKEEKKKELTEEQIRKRKIMLAFPLMCIPFAIAMYFIFFSGSADKNNENESGLNMELPSPKKDEIVEDKRKAYEDESVLAAKADKVKNMESYLEDLQHIDNVKKEQAKKERDMKTQDGIGRSVDTYNEMAEQINTFFQEPKTGDANEELQKQVDSLKKQINSSNTRQNDPMELIEKSYELAAKYINPPVEEKKEEPVIQEKDNSVSVAVKKSSVVSALKQDISDSALLEKISRPRNYGFNTPVSPVETIQEKNTIKGSFYGDQTILDGSKVVIRILDNIVAGGVMIPANNTVHGTAKITGERMDITVSSIEYSGAIIPVNLTAYDIDGQRGLSVPEAGGTNAANEILADMTQSSETNISINRSAGQELAADLSKGIIQGTTRYFSKKLRASKVHVKNGHQLYFLITNNK